MVCLFSLLTGRSDFFEEELERETMNHQSHGNFRLGPKSVYFRLGPKKVLSTVFCTGMLEHGERYF